MLPRRSEKENTYITEKKNTPKEMPIELTAREEIQELIVLENNTSISKIID